MSTSILPLWLNTEPIDREKAATAMTDFYEFCGQPEPEIVFVNGPKELAEKVTPDLEGFSFFDHNDIAVFTSQYGIGKSDRVDGDMRALFWEWRKIKTANGKYLGSSAIFFPEKRFYKSEYKWSKLASEVWDNSYVTLSFKGKTFIVERPLVVETNDRGTHSTDGPAVVFRDGSEYYFWNSIQLTKDQFENPHRITLEFIHKQSDKHMWIAYVGVEHYLKMCKEWEPDVKGKFQKFFQFSQMIVPEDSIIEKSWNKKGRGWMYEDKPEDTEEWQKHSPYKVEFSKGTVNGKSGTVLKEEGRNYVRLPDYYGRYGKHWLKSKQGRRLFDESDRELLDLLLINEQMSEASYRMEITYLNKQFKLAFPKDGRMIHGNCKKNVAPAWFRAKMFLGEDAYYETDKYAFKWSKEKGMEGAGDFGPNFRESPLFGGNEDLPTVWFDVELTSDSWEGLLEKWARLAFEWIQMN